MVTVYAEVADIHKALDRAVELGATIALFDDPQGNTIGVAQPR
jgi:predicted enzyme related to lactoylglutathione lyase